MIKPCADLAQLNALMKTGPELSAAGYLGNSLTNPGAKGVIATAGSGHSEHDRVPF